MATMSETSTPRSRYTGGRVGEWLPGATAPVDHALWGMLDPSSGGLPGGLLLGRHKPWQKGGHQKDFRVASRRKRITDLPEHYDKERHLQERHERLVAEQERKRREALEKEEQAKELARLEQIELQRLKFRTVLTHKYLAGEDPLASTSSSQDPPSCTVPSFTKPPPRLSQCLSSPRRPSDNFLSLSQGGILPPGEGRGPGNLTARTVSKLWGSRVSESVHPSGSQTHRASRARNSSLPVDGSYLPRQQALPDQQKRSGPPQIGASTPRFMTPPEVSAELKELDKFEERLRNLSYGCETDRRPHGRR